MKAPHRIFSILSVLAVGWLLLPDASRADNASLYLTPANISQTAGSNFTINIGVNANGNAINAVEATVNLPSVLGITSAGTGGSLCSIWVQQPTISGSSVSFKCGIPGGTSASGNLMSISVRANTVGSGSASISGARVLAGPGQNVTGGTSGGTYTVTAAAARTNTGSNATPAPPTTAAPAVTSGTHADQNKWYTNNSPSFSWSPGNGVTGFAYALDQSPDTIPSTSANVVTSTSVTFPGQADGTWYFHLRANGTNGWSNVSTMRVQIDTGTPSGLTIVTEPKQVADKRPMVSFAAVDATSGIDHYEISLDGAEFKTVVSPYTPDSIVSGDHTFTVRAFDKAGNKTEGTAAITIKNIPVPQVTSPAAGTTLKLIEQLVITGTADITTTVDLYVDGKRVAQAVPVGDDGTWNYAYRTVLMPGKHSIQAKAVKDGIESQLSEKLSITIDPTSVSLFSYTISIYVVVAALLVLVALLVICLIWLWLASRRQYHRIKGGFVKKNQATEKSVATKLDSLQADLKQDVHATLWAKGRGTGQTQQLEGQITTNISSTKKAISQDIQDQTKGL